MRSGIAAAGNWIVDRVKTVDHWPEQDTLACILEETVGNGGGPFNLLVDLAKLGAPFPLEGIGLVGDDADGNWILETCREHRIGTKRLEQIGRPTSYTDVYSVRSTGRRTFFHQRGANAEFAHVEVSSLKARIFYLGYLLLLDAMDLPDPEFGTHAGRILAQARQAGMKTAVDLVSEDSDRFASVVLPTLPYVDLLFMNEFEAERATGVRLRDEQGSLNPDSLPRAVERIFEAGVGVAVFIHAPEGAVVASRSGERAWQPAVALPPDEIAGSVGAGDAFAAGALFGLHEGKSLEECLHWGCAAAAASLRHPSASEGVRPKADCLALVDRFGLRNC